MPPPAPTIELATATEPPRSKAGTIGEPRRNARLADRIRRSSAVRSADHEAPENGAMSMAPKTKTKTTKRTAAKTKRTPKPKTTAKPKTGKRKTAAKAKPKTVRKMRTVKLASGRKIDRPAEYVERSGSVRVSDHQRASAIASALACTDGTGAALNRAPIGSVQIGDVRTAIKSGKLTTAKAVKLTGAGDWKTLTGYADATIGRTDLPDGMAATIKSLADRKTKTGKTLADRKLTGRALAAAIVGATVADGGKLPTGKAAPTAPVVSAAKR